VTTYPESIRNPVKHAEGLSCTKAPGKGQQE
jgi:hypothetical protein